MYLLVFPLLILMLAGAAELRPHWICPDSAGPIWVSALPHAVSAASPSGEACSSH